MNEIPFKAMTLLVTLSVTTITAPVVASAEGWYWLAPPFDASGLTLLNEAPLSQWQNLGAFDKADECATSRLTAIKSAAWNVQSLAKLPESQRIDSVLEGARRTERWRLASLCISASDPRLAPTKK